MADDGRTYIRLHDGMPDHPKVEPLSDRAFRLLVETWAWCSRHLTDGRVPRASWTRRGTPAARRELVAAGLVEDLGADGVQMHDYLEHQRSRSQVEEIVTNRREARAAASVKANHTRWHVGANGTPSDDCPLCKRTPNGSGPDPKSDPPTDGKRSPSGSHIGIGTDRGIGTVLPEETSGGGVPDPAAGDATPPAPPKLDPANPRCGRHADIPAGDPGPNCRQCRDVRLRVEADTTERSDAEAVERAQRRELIAACPDCDDNGMRDLGVGLARCTHPELVGASS